MNQQCPQCFGDYRHKSSSSLSGCQNLCCPGRSVPKRGLTPTEGAVVELPTAFCRGFSELSLRSGSIQIDCKDMPPGSFPPEFIKHIGQARFRATLDVIVHRFESLGAIEPLESVRMIASGCVSLQNPEFNEE